MKEGRYELEKHIGTGVFSCVYKGVDKKNNDSPVAIKIYRANNSSTNYTNHGRREINLLSLLNEVDSELGYLGNFCRIIILVKLLDYFEEGEHVCLVLESLSKTLCQIIANQGYSGLSLEIVKTLIWQLLVGLAELSLPGVRVIHADLKPDNIMIVKVTSIRVKIIDFGSSCYQDTHNAKYIQSLVYRSPEVMLGIPYTEAIDMWSLGCIMYELHFGRPLFSGNTENEQIVKLDRIIDFRKNSIAYWARYQNH